MTHREQVRRDIEQFGYLAPTLGQHAQRETPLDVLIGIDPAFAGLVATTIDVDGAWWADRFDGPAGERWVDLQRALRRQRRRRRRHLRCAARARKARRGWR